MKTNYKSHLKYAGLLLCSSFLLFSCGIFNEKPQLQTNVYVVGVVGKKAVYWKNGTMHVLADNGTATTIYVSDDDVYVAGTEGNKAVYWKNGTPHSLPTDGLTGSFYVFDGNIYVAGADTVHSVSVATYWKNGTPHHLTEGTKDATAYSIYVDNNGVYVTGTKETGNFAERDGAKFPITKAMYWKNGTLHYLFANRTANPNAIFATDGDVFVAGTTINVTYAGVPAAAYWKDSTLHILSPKSSGFPSGANSIYVFNDDVYVAGFDSNGAGYWENGTQNTLKNGSTATSIYVSDGDVYVAGYKYKFNDSSGSGYVAVYWKNGIRHKLADNGKALSITVTNTKVK